MKLSICSTLIFCQGIIDFLSFEYSSHLQLDRLSMYETFLDTCLSPNIIKYCSPSIMNIWLNGLYILNFGCQKLSIEHISLFQFIQTIKHLLKMQLKLEFIVNIKILFFCIKFMHYGFIFSSLSIQLFGYSYMKSKISCNENNH